MFTRHLRRRGFILPQLMAGLIFTAILTGTLGYTYISLAKSNAIAQQKVLTQHLLTQAAYTITTESATLAVGGVSLSAAGTTTNAQQSTGWNVVSASAPTTDAWGTPFLYCPVYNGQTTATGRIAVSAAATGASVVFALVSGGPDKTVNTDCAHAITNTPMVDDIVRTMTQSQMLQGVGGTVYYGDVTASNLTALDLLGAVQPNQIRATTDGNIYINKTGAACGACTLANSPWTWIAGLGGANTGASGNQWLSPVANKTALLELTSAVSGDVRVELDTGQIWVNKGGGVGNWYAQDSVGPTFQVPYNSSHVTVTASITGSGVTAGGTLTANYTYADSYGSVQDMSAGKTTYQWKRDGVTPTACGTTPLGSTTSATYVTTDCDIAHNITVTVGACALYGPPNSCSSGTSSNAAVNPLTSNLGFVNGSAWVVDYTNKQYIAYVNFFGTGSGGPYVTNANCPTLIGSYPGRTWTAATITDLHTNIAAGNPTTMSGAWSSLRPSWSSGTNIYVYGGDGYFTWKWTGSSNPYTYADTSAVFTNSSGYTGTPNAVIGCASPFK